MTIRKRFLAVPALVLFILAACTTISTQGPLFSQRAQPSGGIPLKDFNIVYKDRREKVDSRKLNIPILTVSGNQDRIHPKMNPEWDRVFTEVVNQRREPGNADLLFLVDILEAYQAFQAETYAEIEYAGAKLRVRVLEGTTNQILAESESASRGSKKTLDASQASIEAMFWDALKTAFVDALNAIPKERLVIAQNVSANPKVQAMSQLRKPLSSANMQPPVEEAESGQPRAIHASASNLQSPSIEIYKMESKPTIVQPGGKFDLVVDYSVRDPSIQTDRIPLEFSYSILKGNKSLFDSVPVLLQAPNGRRMQRVVHLTAAKIKGNYIIRTSLRYKYKIAGDHVKFEIE